jgi:hypothetical protein
MMRQAGMKPELRRWNNPGNSFRRDKSPVAPTRTTTCGYRGPTFEAFFANMWPPRGFVERLARLLLPTAAAIVLANCRALAQQAVPRAIVALLPS